MLHWRRVWTREDKQAAALVGVILVSAAVVAFLLSIGAGRVL
jgi:hypothetical protein